MTRQLGWWRLEREVKQLHKYEVPEFVILPVSGGSTKYLTWVAESVGAQR